MEWMTENSYAEAFDDAMAELRKLLKGRAKINERLSQLLKTVHGLGHSLGRDKKRREQLMNVLDELSVFKLRLTDAVKDALYFAYSHHGHRKLPALQVKLAMEARGYDFSNFPNPLASVHSTLRRLAGQGNIGSECDKGLNVYFWNGPVLHSVEHMLAVDA